MMMTERIPVRAPREYYKHTCLVCRQQWIGWSCCLNGEWQEYSRPGQCNWCKSLVWDHPVKAATQRLKREERKERQKAVAYA
jgi:hypothetical protein